MTYDVYHIAVTRLGMNGMGASLIDRISRWLDFGPWWPYVAWSLVGLLGLLGLARVVMLKHRAIRRYESPQAWKAWLASRWRYRMAYRRANPPAARVDPARFPEERYPVVCPQCEYLLHGLPDGRCPECGTPFERGRLLAQEYVHEWGRRFFRRSRNVAKWCALVGIALHVVQIIFLAVIGIAAKRENADLVFRLMDMTRPLLPLAYLPTVLMFVAFATWTWQFLRIKKQWRAVSDAIHGRGCKRQNPCD